MKVSFIRLIVSWYITLSILLSKGAEILTVFILILLRMYEIYPLHIIFAIHVCGKHACVYVGWYALGVCPGYPPLYLLRHFLSLSQELYNSGSSSYQLPTEIPILVSSMLGFYVGSENPNSYLCVCLASTLLIMSSPPRPFFTDFKCSIYNY